MDTFTVALEEYELMKDSKYRVYVSAVDKALKNFEYTNEWPDLISALGKLNKVLLSHQKFPVIPRRIKISKRLAQCMHPALPSGVHLKALETYDIIFKCMGTNRLSHELFIYSAGLFPLLGHSAMNVRPALLTVYETHFVPLGRRLRPGLSGFLSGVLPGLEEGSDHFERTNVLLEKVCDGVDNTFFYGCLWECMGCNSVVRLPAISFVLSHFNKKLSMEDQLYFMGTDIETMVNALSCGVQDSSVLVQRASLDLLLIGFPMHNSQLIRSDMIRLVTAALSTILRRDHSLNRRLYAWLLGTEVNLSLLNPEHIFLKKIEEASDSSHSSLYFETYSRDLLIQGLRAIFNQKSSQNPDIRPYRLLISLLDKPDVGPVVLDDVLIEVFRALYLACKEANIKHKQELLKAANIFFSSLEQSYIWQYSSSLFDQACQLHIEEMITITEVETPSVIVQNVGSGLSNIWEVCELCEFLLDELTIESYSNTPSEHLPPFFTHIITQLNKNTDFLTNEQVARSLKLCSKILNKIHPSTAHRKISKTESVLSESILKTEIKTKTGSEIIKSGVDLIQSLLPVKLVETKEMENPSIQNEPPRPEETEFEPPINEEDNSLLKQSRKHFEMFYVTLMGGNRVMNSTLVPEAFDQLLNKSESEKNDYEESYATELRKILTAVMNNETKQEIFIKEIKESEKPKINVDVPGNYKWEDAVTIASDILVELSTFPIYCMENEDNGLIGKIHFPPWLKVLIVSACCLRKSYRLQLICIKALLDLISLCETSKKSGRLRGIATLVYHEQIQFLELNTIVPKVISMSLWENLGILPPDLQIQCIELIYQLHMTMITSNDLEKVIGDALLNGNEDEKVENLKKFAKIWHVGREIHTKDSGQKRIFPQCLLKMLDYLQLADANSSLKLHAQTWLVQSLMRGDIARLLDPILLMLLDPATARMGVLHVSIQHSGANSDSEQKIANDDSGRKIYAISSVDGNVIYHVSNTSNEKGAFPKRLKWRWKKETQTLEKKERIFAITSLKDNNETTQHYITEKNFIRDIELPPSFTGSISLFVNPFQRTPSSYGDDESLGDSTDSHIPDYIKNAKRFDFAANSSGKLFQFKEPIIEMNELPKQANVCLEVTTTDSPPVETKFIRQFIKKYDLQLEEKNAEESQSADEYFNFNCKKERTEAVYIVEDILEDVLDSVFKNVKDVKPEDDKPAGVGVHSFHSHMLLYCGVYDSNRTLYAFATLKNIFLANSRLFLCSASASGIVNATFSSDLLILLARHRKCVFGRSFHGDLNSLSEYSSAYRSSMYIEVLVSVCLYFARSYYPNLGLMRLTSEEIAGNRQVQLAAIDLLTHIFSELIPIIRESKKGFANYIADMLTRCKVQKIILHSVMSSILAIEQQQNFDKIQTKPKTFTEEIIEFNDPVQKQDGTLTEHSEAMQIQLLKVLLVLIVLENEVHCQKTDEVDVVKDAANIVPESRYSPGCLVPQQPLFLKALTAALKLKGHMRFLHYNWTEMITTSLPYLGQALQQVVLLVINQLCNNVEELAQVYLNDTKENESLPPDYAVTQLEALTLLCHYCVLDSTQQLTTQHGIISANPGQILNNLVHVFTPVPLLFQDTGRDRSQPVENLANVRRSVLSNMPRIIASVAILWQSVTSLPDCETRMCLWGNPRIIKGQILEFLSPISLHHGVNFLAAIAVAWQERKSPSSKHVLPVSSLDQQVLVNLVNAIRVMPIDTLVQTVHQVVKQPPPIHGSSQDVSLDVSVLELFYAYMQTSSIGVQLGESWTSLLSLLRDGISLAPPALFLILAILNEFVQKSPPFTDKKDQRDLQDITAKLIEACGTIAGACLEQTTWLRRNLAVKEDIEDLDNSDNSTGSNSGSSHQQHSVSAQLVLAQIVAPLLDVSYGSQEKEKVVALLTTLMYNVTPYLKNHLPKNSSSFLACSQLLASLSGFQYTRKAWKRDVFDLLLDSSLFQMEQDCLPYWTTIIDNLMTHDMTTFRDLMSRISVAQPGSYNLFTSKEQEYEQRAQLLKRLAFVIFCSETDQYHKFTPTIQERLSESLRLPQVIPSVQAQVFLCFRVLLLRMTPNHVTSLWPIIISELVQVFMHLEQELISDTEEFRQLAGSHIRNMSALDSSWVVNSNNGLHAHGHPHWLMLSLSAAKLLDLAILLPAQHLPQFQMYRWAFVGDAEVVKHSEFESQDEAILRSHDFIPHVTRIAKLMDIKYGKLVEPIKNEEGQLLLKDNSIDSLTQLHSFFQSLNNRISNTVDMESLEKVILLDFLEKMPNKLH